MASDAQIRAWRREIEREERRVAAATHRAAQLRARIADAEAKNARGTTRGRT